MYSWYTHMAVVQFSRNLAVVTHFRNCIAMLFYMFKYHLNCHLTAVSFMITSWLTVVDSDEQFSSFQRLHVVTMD